MGELRDVDDVISNIDNPLRREKARELLVQGCVALHENIEVEKGIYTVVVDETAEKFIAVDDNGHERVCHYDLQSGRPEFID